jgi:hypothetical protein
MLVREGNVDQNLVSLTERKYATRQNQDSESAADRLTEDKDSWY